MRKISSKVLGLSLVIITLLGVMPIYAQAPRADKSELEKVETVYVNLSPDGSKRQAIDSTWFKNSQFYPTIYESTVLKDIKSVSAAELLSAQGQKQEWKTNGSDVYYQAEVDKTLPIAVDITYTLDGKRMTAEEIAGKSGKLELDIALRHNDYQGELVAPFTAVGVIPLDSKVFSNVKMENGKFFSDGSTQMAIFIGFPSLNQILDLQSESIDELEKIDFPDHFKLTADVKNFELATIAIAASPEIPDMLDEIEDNTEDVQEKIDDIKELNDAKKELEAADPQEKLKRLVRSKDKVNRSQNLVDDLFEFYDLDTAIIEDLEPYVNDKNIALFDRVKADMKEYQVVELLDNQFLRNLPKRFDAESMDKARLLLDWHQEFKQFDESRLDGIDSVLDDRKLLTDFMNDVDDVVDGVRENEDKIDKLEAMLSYSDEVKSIIEDVDVEALTSNFSEEDVDVMVNALIAHKVKSVPNQKVNAIVMQKSQPIIEAKVEEEVAKRLPVVIDQMVPPANTPLTDEQIAGLKTQIATLLPPVQLTSGSAISIQIGQVMTVIESNKMIPEQLRPQIIAMIKQYAGDMIAKKIEAQVRPIVSNKVVAGVKEQVDGGIEATVRAEVMAKFHEGEDIYYRLKDLEKDFSDEFGDDYLVQIKDLRKYFDGLKDDLERLDNQEKDIDSHIQNAKKVFENEADIEYFESWRDKLEKARDDLELNEDNIQLMRELLDEYQKPTIKYLYDNFEVILNDLDEVRPIAESFNDMIEKPANDRALHQMPSTLPTLIKLRRDIYANRDIAEDLRTATDDRVINAARNVLDLIDKQDTEDDLDKLEDELNSVKSVLEKKDELLKLSDQYDNFAGKMEGVKSRVQFIMKTDEIKPEKEEEESIEIEEKKAPSFTEWLSSFF